MSKYTETTRYQNTKKKKKDSRIKNKEQWIYKPNRKQQNGNISPYVAIIILNINRLNSLIKDTERLKGYKKQDPIACYLQGSHFSFKDTHRLLGKGWKSYQRKAEVATLLPDKLDFKLSIHQEDTAIVYMHTSEHLST